MMLECRWPRRRQHQSEFLNSTSTGLALPWQIVAVSVMTCGSVFLMWLGEQIDEHGIGNGISLLIMAGILAQMPKALYELILTMETQLTGIDPWSGRHRDTRTPLCFVHRSRRWRGVHHAWTAQDPHPIGEVHARPKSLRRHAAALAVADQSGWRDADHFREQPAHDSRRCNGLRGCRI